MRKASEAAVFDNRVLADPGMAIDPVHDGRHALADRPHARESIPGIVTFPKATDLHEVAAFVPENRFLIETDSPFLAPVPHRGKRNEPAYVGRVCQVVAELRGTSAAELASATSLTFSQLFNP